MFIHHFPYRPTPTRRQPTALHTPQPQRAIAGLEHIEMPAEEAFDPGAETGDARINHATFASQGSHSCADAEQEQGQLHF